MANERIGAALAACAILAAELPAQPVPEFTWNEAVAARVDEYLRAEQGSGLFAGEVLIARRGEVLFERGYGMADRELDVAHRPGRKFLLASMTKSFTALAVLLLVDDGRLQLDDKLGRWFPNIDRSDEISLRQMLNHTSGLGRDWAPSDSFRAPPARAQVIEGFEDEPLLFDPGTRQSYSTTAYVLLAEIVARATGIPFDRFVDERILETFGLRDTGFYHARYPVSGLTRGYTKGLDRDGRLGIWNAEYNLSPGTWGAGGMYSTARDLLAYTRVLQGPALSPELADALFKPNQVSEHEELRMASGWFRRDHFGLERRYLSGRTAGFRPFLSWYTRDDVVVIGLINNDLAPREEVANRLAGILFGIDTYLPAVRSAIAMRPAWLAAAEGDYQLADGNPVTLVVEDSRLFVLSHGGPPEELFAQSEMSFFSRQHDLQLRIEREGDLVWTYQGHSQRGIRKR